MATKTKPRAPMLVGLCATGLHDRCRGGQDANPDREWVPCTCTCHQETPMPKTPTAELGEPVDTSDEWIESLRISADELNTALRGYSPDDWTDAVRLLRDLRRVTTTLGQLDASLVQWLYLHAEHGLHLHVEGVAGDVSISRGRAKERWEGEAAVKAYVEQQIIAIDGEMPDPLQVAAWVLEVLPATKCRVTPLRAAGIDVDDYRTSEPGTLQVGIPRSDR